MSSEQKGRTTAPNEGVSEPAESNIKNPLEALLVIDRLKVGPAKIEPRKVSTPYEVTSNGEVFVQELVYRYDEAVFDPEEAVSLNLAAMVTAQVALNYGLFCREIVFDGLFDATDQRFLTDMMENTSREIYLKKFGEQNQFLQGEAAQLPLVKQKRYTQSAVSFINSKQAGTPKLSWDRWPNDPQKHVVLSSGGKDSLLTYGLLKEIGREAHPLFINESGRHWFTALNGYRFLKEHEAKTAKVWCNSDRLFNWMLRHMPFIRPDFNRVRADDYPIRLWTVAVFLFGVLPLMRKRGCGRISVGNEYDTTQRMQTEGITHYNGLYDQSRFFDDALSRYYLKKGWGISQFSLLRPLSELLVLKILVKRYPELQAQQMSCHAAHEKEGRIYPCGRCEKCRRIVGMLTAMEEDPSRCGYEPQQISTALKALAEKKVKQLGQDAGQLFYMLAQKGVWQLPPEKANQLKPYPHILKMRFDKERSPANHWPADLREPLFQLMLAHTNGAVRFEKGLWKEVEVLEDPHFKSQYPFDPLPQGNYPKNNHQPAPTGYLWSEMTWPEAEKRFQEVDIALLPVGAIEQHGPHLPLDVDAFDADYLCRRVAEACSDPKPLVLPLIPYGVSYHHQDFKGTLSVRNESMSQFIYDIGMSLARNGIKKLLIVNGHGDNAPTLSHAAQMINRDAGIFVGVDTGETSDVDISKICQTPNDIHAGEIETSTTLAIRPHMVKMEAAQPSILRFKSRYLDFSSSRGVPWYTHTSRISASGVMGDPTKATTEKGKKVWQLMIAHLVSFVEELKQKTLEEIHQKRY